MMQQTKQSINEETCIGPTKKNQLLVSEIRGCSHQGSRKSKIVWELSKNGFHVRSPGFKKKQTYICSFQTNYPYYSGF